MHIKVAKLLKLNLQLEGRLAMVEEAMPSRKQGHSFIRQRGVTAGMSQHVRVVPQTSLCCRRGQLCKGQSIEGLTLLIAVIEKAFGPHLYMPKQH